MSYENFVNNVTIYRYISKFFESIKDKKKLEKLNHVKDILYELDFVNKVKEQIRLIKPVCNLILKSQGKTMSIGEFVGEALKLPSAYDDFEQNAFLNKAVAARHELLVNPLTLSAYAVLPSTDFSSLPSKMQFDVDS